MTSRAHHVPSPPPSHCFETESKYSACEITRSRSKIATTINVRANPTPGKIAWVRQNLGIVVLDGARDVSRRGLEDHEDAIRVAVVRVGLGGLRRRDRDSRQGR